MFSAEAVLSVFCIVSFSCVGILPGGQVSRMNRDTCPPGRMPRFIAGNSLLSITPVEAALRAVSGRMVALESAAKCLVPLTTPDGLYWFLVDIPYYAFLLVFFCTFMSKG